MPEQVIHTNPNEAYPPTPTVQPDAGQHKDPAEGQSKRKRIIPPKPCDYSAEPDGLYMPKFDNAASKWFMVQLANFTANIVGQSLLDDGQDVQREYQIQAKLGKRDRKCLVPASEFGAMNWVSEHLGAEAVIIPGNLRKEHVRAAVQLLSNEVPEVRIFAHTGWRQIDGVWYYLHAGGAIGPDGSVKSLNVSLPEKLRLYKLPDPPADLKEAIRTSLNITDVAPYRIIIPLLAAVYRAAMKESDFTLHLTGETGVLKTALAALGQQHYGADMDAKHLPGSWISTANANEALAFYAKDALFVIDDFVPLGSRNDRSRKNAEADRLVRAQGNSAGRDRMRSDGTLASTKKPRGLLLSTGEATPAGESLRGRMLVVDVERGDVDLPRLTVCQKTADDGRYAEAMSGFVQWLAKGYSTLQQNWREEFEGLRDQAKSALAEVNAHSRLPEVIANHAMGWRYFLDYASDSNALAKEEAEGWWNTGWAALIEAAKKQAHYRADENPAVRFLKLLESAIVAGKAHIADEKGNAPDNPEAWGWRPLAERWLPQGDRVGWAKEGQVYLDSNAAMVVVQRFANETGESIPVTSETLPKKLKQKGLLASTDEARGTLYLRRKLEGRSHNVLHVKWDTTDEDCQVGCQENGSAA